VLVGLLGHQIAYSASPKMQNAAFKATGLNEWSYELFDVPPEELERKASRDNGKAAAKAPAKRAGTKSGTRPTRTVPAPSWQRVAKRGAIFGPFMLITIYLIGGKKQGWPAVIFQTAWLLVLFIPFSYMVDRAMYRRYLKQTGQLPEPRAKKS